MRGQKGNLLPGGAYESLDAEGDNADAHQCFQREDNLVALVDKDAAVDPEHGKVYDENDAECDYKAGSQYILEGHDCLTAIPTYMSLLPEESSLSLCSNLKCMMAWSMAQSPKRASLFSRKSRGGVLG